ncbi:MAG: hypothetical protein H8E19_08890 [Deltaproteobacteria bacterium]|uniref:Uncharacterized protein n=1 Tax=Candidatus Desulfacyla euxinica TaxID=2841693 RepID=A0A8J6MZR5_9DELT|nr:hypothetical protein [Candidatus Desulfacyla euxinica]
MEMLFAKELTIPLYQVGLLLLMGSLLLCLGRVKLGMFINFLFMFYWGYWLNKEAIFEPGATSINSFTLGVYGFSALIFILALIGFLHNPT